MNLWDGRSAEMVLKSYLQAKEREEKERKSKSSDRLSIYHDDWDSILKDLLRTQFNPKNYDRIMLALDTTQNIVKKVVREVSILYKKPPVRDIPKGNPLGDIYEYLDIDEFMKRVERYAFLLNDVLIRVGWDAQLERVTLDLNTPADTSVIQRDDYPEQAAGIYYPIEYADDQFKTVKKNVFWSDFEHFIFDDRGNAQPPSDDNPEMKNPYGVLPFAVLHLEPIPGMFWNPTGGSDLIDGTKLVAMRRTMKGHLFKWQSFKQPWIKSMDAKNVPDEFLIDPSAAVKLWGEGAEIGFLDLQADLHALDEAIKADMNAFLSTYGLSVDMFAATPDETSGRALAIKNRGLAEIREGHLPFFHRLEYDLAQMIQHVYEVNTAGKKPEYGPNSKVALPDVKFSIDYAELNTYTDPMEKRRQAQWDLEHGLISPGQFFMMFNPDIGDEVKAEETIIENMAKTKDMQGKGFNLGKYFGEDNKQQGGQDFDAK